MPLSSLILECGRCDNEEKVSLQKLGAVTLRNFLLGNNVNNISYHEIFNNFGAIKNSAFIFSSNIFLYRPLFSFLFVSSESHNPCASTNYRFL